MGCGGHREEASSGEARKMENTELEDHKEFKRLLRELWLLRERS